MIKVIINKKNKSELNLRQTIKFYDTSKRFI